MIAIEKSNFQFNTALNIVEIKMKHESEQKQLWLFFSTFIATTCIDRRRAYYVLCIHTIENHHFSLLN